MLSSCRLQSAKQINLRVQLVNVVANAIYYSPSLALQDLQQKSSLTTFLPLWFQVMFKTLPGDWRVSMSKKCFLVHLNSKDLAFSVSVLPEKFGRKWGSIWEYSVILLHGIFLWPCQHSAPPLHSSMEGKAEHSPQSCQVCLQMIFEQRADGRRKYFRRQHDKKVCVLSLTALLLAPDQALPGELQSGISQIVLACLKLLQDLKKQQVSYLAWSKRGTGNLLHGSKWEVRLNGKTRIWQKWLCSLHVNDAVVGSDTSSGQEEEAICRMWCQIWGSKGCKASTIHALLPMVPIGYQSSTEVA